MWHYKKHMQPIGNDKQKRELQVVGSHPQQLQVFFEKSRKNQRLVLYCFTHFKINLPTTCDQSMTHLRGFMSAGGPLSNLKLLGFFIFENRNSLVVTFLMFYFYRLSLRALQLRSSSWYYFVDLKSLYLT